MRVVVALIEATFRYPDALADKSFDNTGCECRSNYTSFNQ